MDREQIDEILEKVFQRGYAHGVSGGMSEDGEFYAVDDARKELADYILKREIEARIDEAQKYKWSFVSEQRIEDLNQQLKDIEK